MTAARDDQNALLDFLFEFAESSLSKHGEFFPFGATMSGDGEVTGVAAHVEEERPESEVVAELLVDGMRRQAEEGTIKASGMCLNVRVQTEDGQATDAAQANLEHREGDPVTVFLPYEAKPGGGVEFGELFAVTGERSVFL